MTRYIRRSWRQGNKEGRMRLRAMRMRWPTRLVLLMVGEGSIVGLQMLMRQIWSLLEAVVGRGGSTYLGLEGHRDMKGRLYTVVYWYP